MLTTFAENEKGIELASIERLNDQDGYVKVKYTFKLIKKNTYYNEYNFYDTVEKNQVAFYLFTLQATKGLTSK